MSNIIFEVESLIPLSQNFSFFQIMYHISEHFSLSTAPFPVLPLENQYLLQKATINPVGVVEPFENEIIYIPNKIHFGLIYVKKIQKVFIWNTYKSQSIKLKQIQTTDTNVTIDLSANEVIQPNYWVEKTVVAYPTGKTLMVGDYFKILWELT